MSLADRYRQFAAECLRIAQHSSNPNDKARLVEMAEMWRRLAEKVGTPPGSKST